MAQPSMSPPVTTSASPSHYPNLSVETTLVITVLRDLIWLLCSLISGQLKIGQLWARILDRPQAETVDSPAGTPPVVVNDVPTDSVITTPEEMKATVARVWRGSAVRDLCRAIVSKDFDRVYDVSKAAPRFASAKHPQGWQPLHVAAFSGNADLVKFILDTPGVSVKAQDESSIADIQPRERCSRRTEFHQLLGDVDTKGATSLHFACLAGDWDVIKLLIEHGAGFEDIDNQGRMPVEYFDLEHVDKDVLRSYQEAYLKWKRLRQRLESTSTRLYRAVCEVNYDVIKEILDKGTSPLTDRTPGGWTLLHQAVIRNQPKLVELLLSYVPDNVWVNQCDYWNSYGGDRSEFVSDALPHRETTGAYALHYACMVGNVQIMEMLIRAGADWEYTDGSSRLPEEFIDDESGETLNEYRRLIQEEKDRREEKIRREKAEEEERKKSEEEGEKVASGDDVQNTGDEHKDEGHADYSEESKQSEEEDAVAVSYTNLSIEEAISTKIIGQKGPVRSVASAIRLRENGWVDPDRPLVMLFLGSSGVGKTEVAKQVALYLANKDAVASGEALKTITEIETNHGFIRMDMSEYQQSHCAANLTGSPKGYVGYDEGGILTGKLLENPKAIVLLDEIEKAHPDVLTVFLQVFDDGRITDPKKGTVYCKDAVFIMTSNLASDEIRTAAPSLRKLVDDTANRHEEYMRVVTQFNRKIHPILKASLKRDEFLGRINQIVVFLPLNEEEISIVVNKELDIWRKRAEETHSVRLTWSPTVVAKLGDAYDTHYGVRSVIHEVRRIAVQLVADAQIQGKLKSGWLAHLCINDEGDIDLVAMDSKEVLTVKRGCRFHSM